MGRGAGSWHLGSDDRARIPRAGGAPRAACAAHTPAGRGRLGSARRHGASSCGRASEKLYVRGVTYGTFSRTGDGHQYPPLEVVAADFARMAANGLNAVRTYTVAASLAARHGARTRTVGDGRAGLGAARGLSRAAARGRARSRIGCGRPWPAARAIPRSCATRSATRYRPASCGGPAAGRSRGSSSACTPPAGAEDPGGLFTYVNYPSTEYLESPASDLVAYNVYLESPAQLEGYLARVQNLAGDRPLLMAELGLDSRAHGTRRQAEALDWQVRAAFASGCAGAFVFSWTDEWHVSYLSETGQGNGSVEMRDWDFGLTDREREPKAGARGSAQGVRRHSLRSRSVLAARIRRRLHLQRRADARTLPRGARPASTIPTSR